MKLINQSAKVWGDCPLTKEEATLWIECAGRVCYRSEDKIVEGSGRKFVNNIIKRGHTSVLEHSNFVVKTRRRCLSIEHDLEKYQDMFYSRFIDVVEHHGHVYIGGNIRAWLESGFDFMDELFSLNNSLCELKYVTNQSEVPKELQRKTVEFITDRAVSHELVRHRVASFSQESQRYVGYGEMKFVKPSWLDNADDDLQDIFYESCSECEHNYKRLRQYFKPEHARAVLTNQVATKIIVTATVPQWEEIFKLRCSQAAYPQISKLMNMVKDEVLNG